MDHILTVTNLSKSYNSHKAVDNISFNVQKGKKFVFVGPNGAGKSTTINVLCTLLSKDEGEVRYGELVLGRDNVAIRRKIGVVFQNHTLDDELTVRENLTIRGAMYGYTSVEIADRIEQLEQSLEFGNYINQRYGTLSGGQKRRADIARALLQEPEILFLDEPTTGLDPQTRRVVWEIINQIRTRFGMTVFLTTHYMEETDDADDVVIIDDGKLVASGTPAELKNRYAPTVLKMNSEEPDRLFQTLIDAGHKPWTRSDQIQVRIADSFAAIPLIDRYKNQINSFEVVNGNMDDVFIAITGKEIRA